MEYFPLGLAGGKAFCNRFSERSTLKKNIDLGRSTIVMSPRRYGKSSLVLYVLEALGLPYKRVDLFVTLNEKTIAREIIDGVNALLNAIVTKPQKLMMSIQTMLKHISTKWTVGTDGLCVELSRQSIEDDTLAIRDALNILDQFLQKQNTKAIFFIDEFQEIGVVANAKGIEGAIRSIAEQSKHLIFIFSGSNRHILSTMFEDRSRPLYMLCDKLALQRIHRDDYIKFINDVAFEHWGKKLGISFYDTLFALTECHPYYINLVCGRLYLQVTRLPTVEDLTQIWEQYVVEEKSKTAMELAKLSTMQKKLLIVIAHGQHDALSSKAIVNKVSGTSGAVVKALKVLIEKDYVFEDADFGYRIVDPLIKSSIRTFFKVSALI